MKKYFLKLVIAVSALTGASTVQAQSIYEPYSFGTLAGLALNSGSTDNTGSLARFNQPWGLAVDGANNVYVADILNHTIRKITPGGIVTTLAGVAGSPGFTNGPANAAQFSRPTGVAVNSAGTVVYVADYNNHLIRQISGGVVTTLAGSVGVFGTNDGTGVSAQFHNPFGVVVNSAGTLVYVSDQYSQTIRMITVPGGVVTTLAGSPNLAGSADGANNAARFNQPRGIALDSNGNLYVADAGNLTVRKILSGGGVSTLAGAVTNSGFTDGTGSAARFSNLNPMSMLGGPCGVAVDSGGNVYVTDQGNHTIRKITPGGSVTTLAGLALASGSADGTGSAARFNYPAGVAVDGAGRVYMADTVNHTIRTGVNTNTNPCPNLVVNGSFEVTSPAMTPNTFNNSLDPTTGVPGWTTAAGNFLEIWCNTVSGIPASLGTNQLEINAQSVDEIVSQVVTGLSTNCPATFCFDYTGRFGMVGGTPNNDFTVTLSSGGILFSVALDPAAYAAGGWISFCTNFVPTSSTITIAFRGQPHFSDGTTATQGGAHIDNVSLTQCCDNPCAIPLVINCATNKTVDCGTGWKFDLPTATSCCSTNVTITSAGFVTNGVCPKNITQNWLITDGCGNSNTCSQTVTLRDTERPTITCPTNRIIVALGANCQLEIPTIQPPASDNCTPASQLVYTQNPPAGAIVPGPCQLVTVTVRDACDNVSQCQVLVCGQDKTPPTVIYPKSVTVTNCIVPNVLALVSASDNCTASNQLVFTQSPPAGTPIAAGGNQVAVTVTDQNGNTATCVIPLINSGGQSFLNVMFNTAVDNNKAILPNGSVDPHFTLGPVPVGTLTGPGHYNAPNAIVELMGNLPPFTQSQWITPYYDFSSPDNAPGAYTYTNQFTLPAGADPLAASVSGRWASFVGTGEMFFNGSSTPVSSDAVNGWGAWTYFTINSGFLAYPAVNKIYFVVTIPDQDFTGLRVEFTDAVINCSTCTPPAILQKTRDQSLPLNSTAMFSASVWGTPPLTIQWYHNGLPLTNGVHYPNGVTNTTLTITPLGYADAGIYTVALSNSCGGTASVPAKLTITRGWPWPWAWWNFSRLDKPFAATVGPDLILKGTNIFGFSFGTTLDFDLPGIGGKIANVMAAYGIQQTDTPINNQIDLPFIVPQGGGDSVSNYTVIMDVLVPSDSTNPVTLFNLVNDHGAGGQDSLRLRESPTLQTANISVQGMVGGVPFNLLTPMNNGWNRVALVVIDWGDGHSSVTLSLNGKLAGSASITKTGPGTLVFSSSSLATVVVVGSADGNGIVYASSIAFFDDAMTPEMIASIGGSDNGPFPVNDPSMSVMPPALSEILLYPIDVKIMWDDLNGGAFFLEETSDLTSGVWTESFLPFTQMEKNGNISTTADAIPSLEGRVKFYRLHSYRGIVTLVK
jgi:DNA-binding beta-propeller fold protein YncE